MINNNKIKTIFIISTMMLIITSCIFIIQKNPVKNSYATEETQKQLSAIIKIDDNEYDFDNVDSLELGYNKTSPKVYDVEIKLNNIPTTATDIKLLIDMPVGMKYIIDGSENDQLQQFLNGNILKTSNEKIWEYQNENTGKREYSIIDNTTDIVLPIRVALDEVVFANEIDDAIDVTLTYTNDGIQQDFSTSLKKVTVDYDGQDQVHWHAKTSKYLVITDKVYSLKDLQANGSSKSWSYSFVNGSNYPGTKKLARKIELQLTAKLKRTGEDITEYLSIDIDTDKCTSDVTSDCWNLFSPSEGQKYYSITKENTIIHDDAYGIPWNIKISSEYEENNEEIKTGDQVVVTGKLIYTYYGGNPNSNLTLSEGNSSFTRTFIITDETSHVWVGFSSNSNAYSSNKSSIVNLKKDRTAAPLVNENNEENIKRIDIIDFGNYGGIDSEPKTIEFNFFMEDILRVKSMMITPITENATSSTINLMLKINNESNWKRAKLLDDNNNEVIIKNEKIYYYYQFCIIEGDACIRLDEDDTINAIKYDIGSIPASYEKHIYLNGTVLKKSDEEIKYTLEIYDTEGSDDINHLNSTGVSENYIKTTAKKSTIGITKLDNLSSMAGDKVNVSYRINGNDSNGGYSTIRVNSYIRETFGRIDIESIKLINSRGYNLTDKNNKQIIYENDNKIIKQIEYIDDNLKDKDGNSSKVIISKFKDKDGINVYKIDTSNVVGTAACLYCNVVVINGSGEDKTYRVYADSSLTLSYDINTNITDNGGTYYYKDMIFAENANKEYEVVSYSTNRTIYSPDNDIYERFNVDGNNINLKSIVGTGTNNVNSFIEVKTKSDILMTNELKIDGETVTWDKTEANIPKINSNKEFSVIEKIINNSGTLSGKDSVIYIPISKQNENWGSLSNNEAFKWTTKLVDQISNNDKLNISYGNITPSGVYETINNQSNKFESYNELNKANYNCIKIVLKENLDIDEIINIEIPLISDVDEENQNEIIKFKSIYYRNLTNKDNEKYAGVTTGELVGLKLYDESKIIIKYQDEDGNKLLEDEEKIQQVGTNYELDEIKEIENYNLKEIEGNPTGKYMLDDIEITYIYELEEKEVIVHYYKENTTEKLTEDEVIKGKVTTKEEISSKEIANYDLVSEEKQEVEFGEDTEIIFYYKKQKGKKVILEYVDEENNYIKDSESKCEDKELGESCNISCIEIEDYTLLTNPKDYSIEITKEMQTTQCKYKLNNGEGVIIKYFDENEEELSKEENTCINQKLKSECIVECKKIEGYTIETKDKYTFKITKEKQEQVCKYKKIEEKEEEPQQPEEKKEEKPINPATGIKDIILITVPLLSIGSIIYIKKKRVY